MAGLPVAASLASSATLEANVSVVVVVGVASGSTLVRSLLLVVQVAARTHGIEEVLVLLATCVLSSGPLDVAVVPSSISNIVASVRAAMSTSVSSI